MGLFWRWEANHKRTVSSSQGRSPVLGVSNPVK